MFDIMMTQMKKSEKIKKLGLIGSFAIYIPAAVLMYCLTTYVIPWLSNTTGQETILFWFIVAGLGIFLPLIITGVPYPDSPDLHSVVPGSENEKFLGRGHPARRPERPKLSGDQFWIDWIFTPTYNIRGSAGPYT